MGISSLNCAGPSSIEMEVIKRDVSCQCACVAGCPIDHFVLSVCVKV